MEWACRVLVSGKRWPADDAEPWEYSSHAASRQTDAQLEASYICDACGEEIVIPLDVTEGVRQTYVEDCPVCCRANTIHVELQDDGSIQVWSEPEQDYSE
ncbi:MAG: CPXCG motif-containing cysteine-rich protein [Planctomycetales bacterium]|nr:CPXCG motif-containing cysteine-rich protein [Planctomycetales bacterium]